MKRTRTMVLSLVAVITMMASLAVLGCGDDDNNVVPAQSANVGARSFSFASGQVFDPALTNVPTTLSFNSGASTFALQAPVGGVTKFATGTNTFGSCILKVGAGTNPSASGGGSNFAAGTGPQPNATITLSTCDVDNNNNTLTVSNGTVTVTSGTAGSPTGSGGNGQ